MSGLEPVRVSGEELGQWSADRRGLLELGCLVARYAPRGKGWFPRQLGRRFGRGFRCVMRTRHGAQLAVDANNLDVYTSYALEPVLSEADVIAACRSVLTPGDVLYDVGANAGLVFLELTALFGGRLRTIAFEPQPTVAHAAAVSAALNGFADVTVYQALVGPQSGDGELFVSSGAAQASTKAAGAGDVRIAAPIVALDDLVADAGIPAPTLIKVDVEGAEMGVFRGAEQLIRTHRPYLVFETLPECMARFGHDRGSLLRYVHGLAEYRFFTTDSKRPGVLTPEPVEGPYGTGPNVLAVPAGRPDPRPAA